MNIFREILQNRKLIFKLAKNDFKTKYSGSYFGTFWAFMQPIVTVCIYVFVFQVGFKASGTQDGSPYVLYLIGGIVPWFFFSEALVNGTNCLIEYSYLVKKVVFNITTLPVVKIMSSFFVHLFFVMLALLICAIFGKTPTIYFIQIIYFMICNFCLVLGMVFFTSAIIPFFKDFGQIINIFVQIFMWMTPVMWQMNAIPPNLHFFLKLNPVCYIVDGYRNCYIGSGWFFGRWQYTIYFWCVTVVLMTIGIKTFNKLRVHFSDVL